MWPKPLILGLSLAFALGSAQTDAGERINTDEDGIAIKGYDPVAYHLLQRPVEGDPNIAFDWQDARWQFATAEHRELFSRDPEAYAPRYGGHCAGAMARGILWTIDPEAWAIVDGKLYLNFRKSGIERFKEDPAPEIEKADAHWKELRVTD